MMSFVLLLRALQQNTWDKLVITYHLESTHGDTIVDMLASRTICINGSICRDRQPAAVRHAGVHLHAQDPANLGDCDV